MRAELIVASPTMVVVVPTTCSTLTVSVAASTPLIVPERLGVASVVVAPAAMLTFASSRMSPMAAVATGSVVSTVRR